jgi:hypothetical protein
VGGPFLPRGVRLMYSSLVSLKKNPPCVCVFITVGPSTDLFAWGGGGYGRTCATRDDEPRPVWTSLPITH